AFGDGFDAQIAAPFPTGDVGFDGRILGGQHAEVAVAANDQRADVAGIELVHTHDVDHGGAKLVNGEGNLDTVNFGGIVQAAGVFAHAEDARAGVGRVAADAFKHRTAVAGYVRKDVDLGVSPVNHASVVPDFF